MRGSYYNELDPYAAQWLRNLIAAGHIAPGDVDERSIEDVEPADIAGYSQCHFFAGIGVWSYALRLAGWPDDKPIWTGSPPCQSFSAAGKQRGFGDRRHLWPEFFRLIQACRPAVVVGEQVPAAIRFGWLDLVFRNVATEGYALRARVLGAHSVGAPHIRQRLFWTGHTVKPGLERHGGDGDDSAGRPEPAGSVAAAGGAGRLADASGERVRAQGLAADAVAARGPGREAGQQRIRVDAGASGAADGRSRPTDGFWRDADWLFCRDGRWRPIEPGLSALAPGLAESLGRMRAIENDAAAEVVRYGNANKRNADEVLRMVWQAVQAQACRTQPGDGVLQQLHAPEILLPLLLGIRAACEARADARRITQARDEARWGFVRSLRVFGAPCCPPRQWESDGQQQGEPADALLVLSQLLARHAEAYRQAAHDADAAADRKGRLKGYGNAIVAPLAAEFVRSVMETIHAD